MTTQCPNCGEEFTKLPGGKIPTHDFPRPCRRVCPGAGQSPRRQNAPLWKDDPAQQERDFVAAARFELLIYAFAIVKNVAGMRVGNSGTMSCPLCQKTVRYSVSPTNGHCSAKCETADCLSAME